jgi:integrase
MANHGVDFAENGWPFATERVFQAIEYARRHGKTREWRDTHPSGSGLVLRVGPSKAAFYMRCRVDGRMVATKLGAAEGPGRLSVDDARRALQRGKFGTPSIHREGTPEKSVRSVISVRSSPETTSSCGQTVAQVWDAYIAAAEAGTFSMRRRQRKPLKEKTAAGYRSIYSAHLKAHADQPLEWLADHAAEMFERLGAGGHGALANQFLAVTKAIFEYARRGGIWEGSNPIADPERFEKFAVRERELNLTDRQMVQLLAAINQQVDPYPDLFTLAIFTGQRSGNCQGLRWNQIDLDRGTIRFKAEDRKNARADVIPIATEIVAMLRRRLKARSEEDGGYVFPSPKKPGTAVSTYKLAWARVKEAAGLEDVEDLCVHGLRHNFGSWGQESSAPDSSITAAVGHASGKSTERYKHGRSIVVARPAVDAIAGRLGPILKAAKKTKLPATKPKKPRAK